MIQPLANPLLGAGFQLQTQTYPMGESLQQLPTP